MAVAAGLQHSVALDANGNVWTWGEGDLGELGNGLAGDYVSTNVPVMLTSISNVIAIAAGQYHTIALTTNKTVWTWGDATYGELGRDTPDDMYECGCGPLPRQVNALSNVNVVAIAGGQNFTLAVISNGQVYAWGDNSFEELGTYDTTDSVTGIDFTNSPLLVAGISNAVLVSAGTEDDDEPYGGYHAVAMTVDQGTNHYWGWGDNTYGETGNGLSGGGTNQVNQVTPAQVQFCTRCQRNVQLGTTGSFTAECHGTLYLYFNDEIGQFGANTGSYMVAINGVSTNVPAYDPSGQGIGIAVGTVTNGGMYTYSATGLCYSCNSSTNCWTDADGNHNTNMVDCSSINITNLVCAAARCFSLVGKIQ